MQQTFTKEVASLEGIAIALKKFAEMHGLGKLSCTQLELVVEELFTNMVKYSKGAGNIVGIRVEALAGELRIELTEPDVSEFNPFQTAQFLERRPADSQSTGGRGLHLVREIAEEVSYHYINRTGTTVVVMKTGDKHV